MIYAEAPEFQEKALLLQEYYPANFEHINMSRVAFLKEIESKPKKKLADTTCLSPLVKALIPHYDYVITFYMNALTEMTEDQLDTLVFHELVHISEQEGKLVDHDVKDFSVVIVPFGHDWAINKDLVGPLSMKRGNVPTLDRDNVETYERYQD